MSSKFASAYGYHVDGPTTFSASTVAQKRGHGPSTLDITRSAIHPSSKKAAVRGHVGDTPAIPTFSKVDLPLPAVNEKPVQGTLAGNAPPKLPPPPERKSPFVIVTSPNRNSYNAVVDEAPFAYRTRRPALPALKIPEQGLLKATMTQTPGVLGSPFKSPLKSRPSAPVTSPGPSRLQVPQTFHSSKNHRRSNAMMATPPLSAVFKIREIVRFDGKSPAHFMLFEMKKREGQTIARIFSTAFDRLKRFMVGLSQRARDATGKLGNLRAERANGGADGMRSWAPGMDRDVEAAKFDHNVSVYLDADMFLVKGH